MKITKLTGFVGAEVAGLDLAQPLSDTAAADLRAALTAHGVLMIRDQHLTLLQQKQLTRTFGPAMQLPYVAPLEGDPEVIAVLKEAAESAGGVFGGAWHSDFSFLENPPAGSILSAVEVPPYGGDTLWASQVAAYASLPSDLRKLVDTRKAIHVGAPYGVKHAPAEGERAGASIRMTRGDPEADRERLHPSVITDPLSGARALFLNPIYVTRFDGMTEEESQPLLQELYTYATKPDICCRLRWQAGDVAIWDNRLTMHYATNDYDGHRRLLYRTTFAGNPPT